MWPLALMLIGAVTYSGGAIWYYISHSSVEQPAVPNISFQKFALVWVQTDKEVYELGVVAKLFDADNKSYLLNGLTFDTAGWKLVPRGG